MNKDNSNIISGKIEFIQNHKFNYIFFLSISILLFLQGAVSTYLTFTEGLGLWGINDLVCWAFDITNFVYWIGLAHSGALISAILLLLRQSWRSTFNRQAETMTLISIVIALTYPIIHTGRPWFAWYWLAPYPNDMALMPNFKSPLVWDYFAIPIYFFVSFVFWYIGMIPDFAMKSRQTQNHILFRSYSKLSLGWNGSNYQWNYYRQFYLLLAGIITPLVIAVHTIVSYDFSVTLVTGWHLTIFPPYFVAGAIFSGCAFVQVITLLKEYFGGKKLLVKRENIEKMNKIILTFSLIIAYVYLIEIFFAFYSGSEKEIQLINRRITGDLSLLYLLVLFTNFLIPQFLWIKKIRSNKLTTLVISTMILLGMWLERYMIVVGSLKESPISEVLGFYFPSLIEISLLLGSFGMFFMFYLIIIKILPINSNFDIDFKL